MSTHYNAADYKLWTEFGLKDYGDFAEMVEFVNCREDGFDSEAGEWFYVDDENRTIYWGTFGNYNSPGASHYTYAEVYDFEELNEFDADVLEWNSKPEYLEDDEPEDIEGPEADDYVTSDYRRFYQCGKCVVSISQEEYDADPDCWVAFVRTHMDAEQFWPNVWLERERGGYDLLSLDTGNTAD